MPAARASGKVVICIPGRRSRSRRRPRTGRSRSAGWQPPARRRIRHHPRQCPRAGGRVDPANHCRPDRLAPPTWSHRRVISWLSQAPLVLDDRRAVLSPLPAQLTRQVRHLRHIGVGGARGVTAPAGRSPDYGALCMAPSSAIRSCYQRLGDGWCDPATAGNISRSRRLMSSWRSLAAADRVYARNIARPGAAQAIDRMMPMLRFFRHVRRQFALFNGMGPTQTDLLTTILAYDDAAARRSPMRPIPAISGSRPPAPSS